MTTNTVRPMRLSFIGSERHILSECVRESQFKGIRQLFANMQYKFNNPVLDTYCPSNYQSVAYDDFVQVVRDAHLEKELSFSSDNKNLFITAKLQDKNITYCLYCVYDEPAEKDNPHTHYYLVALERDHLSDTVQSNLDHEIAVSIWKDYINVIEESETLARAF